MSIWEIIFSVYNFLPLLRAFSILASLMRFVFTIIFLFFSVYLIFNRIRLSATFAESMLLNSISLKGIPSIR